MANQVEASTSEAVDSASPPRRRRWGRRVVLTLLVLALLLFAAQWGAGRRAQSGLAGEMAKYRAAGEPATVEELNRWPGLRSGEGENAAPLLRAAAALCNTGTAVWNAGTDAAHAPPLSDAEQSAAKALAEAHAEALAKLDEACAAPRIDWDPQYRSPMMRAGGMPTDLSEQRGLVQLAHAAALAAHARGDDAEALKRIGQMMFVGRALGYQPGLVYQLVGVACDASACRAAADLAPGLRVGTEAGAATPAQVRRLIDTLRDEQALAEAQRRALVSERVTVLDFPNALGAAGAGAGGPLGGFNFRIPGVAFFVRPYVVDNARAMARYVTHLNDTATANPDLPAFNAAMTATDPMPEATKLPRRYAMASSLVASLAKGPETHYVALAHRRLAATCLAARLYALDHGGKLPETLSELVPDYLPAVPVDPLGAGGVPLRYINDRTDPGRPRVYSVGKDGIDNGGADPPPATGAAPGRGAPADEVRHLKSQLPAQRGEKTDASR